MRLAYAEIERRMACNEYTQTGISCAMGAAPSFVSSLFRRIREGSEVTPRTAGRLARALGCAVEDLQEAAQ